MTIYLDGLPFPFDGRGDPSRYGQLLYYCVLLPIFLSTMSNRANRTAPVPAAFLLALLILAGCQMAHMEPPPLPLANGSASALRRLPAISGMEWSASADNRPVGENKVVLTSATIVGDEAGTQLALAELIGEALAANPQIGRAQAEAAAAWERVPQVRSLQDPMIQATGFGQPQFMADGKMWATLMVSQAIPYLKQLNAQGQQAAFEALILQQEARAARLRIAAEVEEAWLRLYLLGQLLQINEANRQLIKPLVDVATGRVEVGETAPGDVVLGTLELSRTEEERLMLEQQVASQKATMNRLLNRPADSPIEVPESIDEALAFRVPAADWSLDELRAVAFEQQPEIVAARLRTQATAWGIRMARWEGVPEVAVLYEHMFMEMNPGEEGSDPWRVGVEMNVPLWRRKYRARVRETRQENLAAHQAVEVAVGEYDAMLLDLLQQERAAEQTATLYRNTIMPQARQALEVDQRAYGQGTVTFERVISNARNVLTAESAYVRATVDQAIAIARIRQAAGGQLPTGAEELEVPELLPPPIAD
jgi:outer membrane protein TolC